MRTLAAITIVVLFPGAFPAADGPAPDAKPPIPLQPAISAVLKKVTPSVAGIGYGDKLSRSVTGGVVVGDDIDISIDVELVRKA